MRTYAPVQWPMHTDSVTGIGIPEEKDLPGRTTYYVVVLIDLIDYILSLGSGPSTSSESLLVV